MFELEDLLASLDAQRSHVLGILEGIEEPDLRRPVLPSGWALLGLVQHLCVDVERFWFRAVMAAEPAAVADAIVASSNAWEVDPAASAASILDAYRREVAVADDVIRSRHPDDPPAWWPGELFGSWRLASLRQVVLHVITETACHAGHLDAARELLDGRRWMVIGE